MLRCETEKRRRYTGNVFYCMRDFWIGEATLLTHRLLLGLFLFLYELTYTIFFNAAVYMHIYTPVAVCILLLLASSFVPLFLKGV